MVGKLTPDDIVTASRVPALMGLSPYKTPNELLKEAIEAAAGNPPRAVRTERAMRFGDLLEGDPRRGGVSARPRSDNHEHHRGDLSPGPAAGLFARWSGRWHA